MSDLDSVLREERVFPPSEAFRSHANLKSQEEYNAMYRQSIDDPDTFWSKVASELDWFSPWDQVLDWKFPFAKPKGKAKKLHIVDGEKGDVDLVE